MGFAAALERFDSFDSLWGEPIRFGVNGPPCLEGAKRKGHCGGPGLG